MVVVYIQFIYNLCNINFSYLYILEKEFYMTKAITIVAITVHLESADTLDCQTSTFVRVTKMDCMDRDLSVSFPHICLAFFLT